MLAVFPQQGESNISGTFTEQSVVKTVTNLKELTNKSKNLVNFPLYRQRRVLKLFMSDNL